MLDTAYQAYLGSTSATDRLSRSDWFKSVSGNAANKNSAGGLTPGADGTLTLDPKFKATDTTKKNFNDPVEADKFRSDNFVGKSIAEISAFLSNPENTLDAQKYGILGDYSDVSKIKYDDADYADKASKNNGWIVAPDNKAYHMEKVGGDDYGATLGGVGNGFVVVGADGKPYFMVTKSISGGKPIGTVVPLTENSGGFSSGKNNYLSYGNDTSAIKNTKLNGKYYYYAGGA